tara:strand:- start:985 stop:1257 length:273 start_codon:yes stop_codon:yes gene_type:complete
MRCLALGRLESNTVGRAGNWRCVVGGESFDKNQEVAKIDHPAGIEIKRDLGRAKGFGEGQKVIEANRTVRIEICWLGLSESRNRDRQCKE